MDPTPDTGRLPGLDRLRGAALLLMLVHHLIDWFVVDARRVLPGWDGFVVTDVAAPAFFATAGASAWLLRAKLVRRGCTRRRAYVTLARRYGLLVAAGVGLRVALGWDADGFGVLEALGVSVLVAMAIAEAVRPRALVTAAVSLLVAAPAVEAAARPRQGWLADEVLAGKFPVVLYVAFAVAGAAAVTVLAGRDRPAAALRLGALAAAVVTVFAVAGHEPDRYPGGAQYVVPAVAGTCLLYGALATSRSFERALRPAAAHSLGLFIGHYGVFAVFRASGHLRTLPVAPGLVVVAAVTTGLVRLAPRVPRLPWSPRTGRRRRLPSELHGEPVRPAATHPEAAGNLAGSVAGAGAGGEIVA